MHQRICVLHVGTHKTGTTSIQTMLRLNRDVLRGAGLFAPPVGLTEELAGNHRVAWDLLNENYDDNVAELLAALADSTTPFAVVSAEDLSLVHRAPDTLPKFAELIRQTGYEPKILVYLRAQGPYAESMYVERIKHGDIRMLSDYLHEIFSTGMFTPKNSMPIQFAYDAMLERFAQAVGYGNIVVRPYPLSGDDNAIYSDFMEALNLLAPAFIYDQLPLEVSDRRVNESLTFGQLMAAAYLQLHEGAELPPPQEFVDRFTPQISPIEFDGRFALLTRDEQLRIANHFAAGNAWIAQRFRVAIPFAGPGDVKPSHHALWELVHRERRALDRCLSDWLKRKAESQPASE